MAKFDKEVIIRVPSYVEFDEATWQFEDIFVIDSTPGHHHQTLTYLGMGRMGAM
jgi:hypothetical protein